MYCIWFWCAVKTRKEARQMGLRDSISATQSRIEVLRRSLQLQKSKREEYAKVISQQLQGICQLHAHTGDFVKCWTMRKNTFSLRSSESLKNKLTYVSFSFQSNKGLSVSKENAGKVTEDKADINEAISWYNQALGFHVEAGHGKWEKLLSLEQSYLCIYYWIFDYWRSCCFTFLFTGVKFTFTNVDAKWPTREFSFTIHYGTDIYTRE